MAFDTDIPATSEDPDAPLLGETDVPVTPEAVIPPVVAPQAVARPMPNPAQGPAGFPSWQAYLNAYEQARVAAVQRRNEEAQFNQLLEQSTKIADASKAIESAMRFQGLRGYERDLEAFTSAGIPRDQAQTQALTRNAGRMFWSSPATALKAMTPVQAPTKLEMAGMPPAILAGGRPYWPPASAMPAEPLSTTGQTLRDEQGRILGTGFPTGPRSRMVIREPSVAVRPGSLTAVENAIIRGIDRDATEKRKAMDKLKPTSNEYLDLGRDLDALVRRRNRILAEAGNRTATLPPPPSMERIRVRDKTGSLFTIPKSQRQQAIDEGYTPVE